MKLDTRVVVRERHRLSVAVARPKKVDIDAMHSYGDAIRDESGNRVVRFAAILFRDKRRSTAEA
jgi:hypothetical protein